MCVNLLDYQEFKVGLMEKEKLRAGTILRSNWAQGTSTWCMWEIGPAWAVIGLSWAYLFILLYCYGIWAGGYLRVGLGPFSPSLATPLWSWELCGGTSSSNPLIFHSQKKKEKRRSFNPLGDWPEWMLVWHKMGVFACGVKLSVNIQQHHIETRYTTCPRQWQI